MKYLSLFSGIGGFELGIQQALSGEGLRAQAHSFDAMRGGSTPITRSL